MILEWFWPYDNAKKCWLAAMSLLYDKKYEEVEYRTVVSKWLICTRANVSMTSSFLNQFRPRHKHRWLAEKNAELDRNVIWQCKKKVWCRGAWEDKFFDEKYEWRPHPEKEPILYKWYLEEKSNHV